MLHLAYRKDHQKCIELLRKAGADPGKKDTRDLKAYQRDHWIEGSREGCEGQAAHEQQHIPPVPAESGVQSDESQQENSSDEEAAQEEMSLSVLNPKHQLVCAGSYSSQPDHKDPPRDSSYVHSAEELLPSILPFSAYAGDDYHPVTSPAVPPSQSIPPSFPPSDPPSVPPSLPPPLLPSDTPPVPPSDPAPVPPSDPLFHVPL